jgi:hypothetical protein
MPDCVCLENIDGERHASAWSALLAWCGSLWCSLLAWCWWVLALLAVAAHDDHRAVVAIRSASA